MDAHEDINHNVEAVRYLTAESNRDYVAIMDVLVDASFDLTPSKVSDHLAVVGIDLPVDITRQRLIKLHQWQVVSETTALDSFSSFKDFQASRQEYAVNALGRAVHHFFRTTLAGDQRPRAVDLNHLQTVVRALETLADDIYMSDTAFAENISTLFTSHEQLDAALIGAADTLSALMIRFDLDDDGAAELRGMLNAYSTSLQYELDMATDRGHKALTKIRPNFPLLADRYASVSVGADLVASGTLIGQRGTVVDHWRTLDHWMDPRDGRAERFNRDMRRAVPTFVTNVRRLLETNRGSTRDRAIALAKAAGDATHAAALFATATGDHSWTKFAHISIDEPQSAPYPSWEHGALVPLPRFTKHGAATGGRGRTAGPRDDSAARAQARAEREAELAASSDAAVAAIEIGMGSQLPDAAARLVLAAINAGVGSDETLSGMDEDSLVLVVQQAAPGARSLLIAPTWKYLVEDYDVTITAGPELAIVPEGEGMVS